MSTEQLVHDLGDTLQRTLSPDAAIRNPAEKSLTEFIQRRGEAMYGLALVGRGAGGYGVEIRVLALVLLRSKSFTTSVTPTSPTTSNPSGEPHAPFDNISEKERERVEACLMSALRDEFDGRVRRAVGEVVGRWARESGKRGRSLSGLPQAIISLAATTSPLHRLSVYQLFIAYPDILFVDPDAGIQPRQVIQVLAGGMDDSVQEVKVEAVRATAAVLSEGEGMEQMSKSEFERFGSGLVAKICGILGIAPLAFIDPVLEALTTIADYHPNLFTPTVLFTLVPILQSFSSLPEGLSAALPNSLQFPPPLQELDDFTESYARFTIAVNLFVALLERTKKAALSKSGAYRAGMDMVPVMLAWLAVGISPYIPGSQDEQLQVQSWIERDDNDEEDDEAIAMPKFGLEAFADILPQPEFLRVLFEYLPTMISAPDWRLRAGGLEAIGAISASTKDAIADKLQQILDMVAGLASDPHPRVLFSVADAIGNIAEVFDSDLTATNRQKCFDILKYLLGNPTHRVAEHAAKALVPLIDASDKAEVVPHLGEIVSGIVALLQNRPLYVQQQALKTLASAAITVNDAFQPYYHQLMPDLLGMLSTPMDKDHRMLKAVGIECTAFIGLAAGKQTFKEDGKRLAGIMMEIQQSITEDDDPQLGYLTSTWSHVANALGEDFEPWVAPVMERMLRAALQPVKVKAYEDDSGDIESGWELINDQYLLDTSALSERLTNVQELAALYGHLGARLAMPFLDEVAKSCVENLTFKLDENVRMAAAGLVPTISGYAKELQNAQPVELVLRALLDAILREEDFRALKVEYTELADTLDILHPTPLPTDVNVKIAMTAHFYLSQFAEARTKRMEFFADEESGEDALAWERGREEEEDEVLDAMTRVLKRMDSENPLLFTIGGLYQMSVRE